MSTVGLTPEQILEQAKKAAKQKRDKNKQEHGEEEQKTARPQRNRQANIDPLLRNCPLCNAAITPPEDIPQIASQKFMMIQQGANNDNTGWESYVCQYCNKQIMMVISGNVIVIQPQFQMGALYTGGQVGNEQDPNAGAQAST